MSTTIKEKLLGNRLTPTRVAIIGMLLALFMAFKFILGFVPGIEVVSFMFIFVALFLPFIDLIILVSAFNFLILAIYGFGTWWLGYWPIFMIDVVVSFSLKNFSKNIFFFSFLCFMGGINVGFWYYILDLAFYDSTYATLNLITAIPVNLAESFSSMFIAILFGQPLAKVFQINHHKFWEKEKIFKFKLPKYKIFGIIILVFLSVGSLIGTVLPLIYNNNFLDWRQNKQEDNHLLPINYQRDERLISTHDYNDIYKKLNQGDNAIIVVIGKKHFLFIAKESENALLKSELSNSEFYISYFENPNFGIFLKQTFLRKNDKQISPNNSNGLIGSKKDFDASPFIYINGESVSSGAESLKLKSKDIVEISYNDIGGKLNGKSSTTTIGTYILNNGKKIHNSKRPSKIWIPITAGISAFGILLFIIWSPNIIKKIKQLNKIN